MKLSKGTVLGGILLLVLVLGAYGLFAHKGQSGFVSESGFRGFKWGSPPPSHFSPAGRAKYFNIYGIANDKLALGDAVNLWAVHYSFLIVDNTEKFESARIDIDYISYGSSVESQVLDVLTKEYGKYTEKKEIAGKKSYIFEDKYVTAYYLPRGGSIHRGEIIISSKEMRSRYPGIYEKAEKEATDF